MPPSFIHLTNKEVLMPEAIASKMVTVTMEYKKGTPNMNVFECKELAVMTSLYIHKSFSEGAKKIKVTVEVVE